MKILCLNTNRNSPLQNQRDLIERIIPDVICLQEMREDYFFEWLEIFESRGIFAPQWYEYMEEECVNVGSAIITTWKDSDFENHYYRGNSDSIPFFNGGNIEQAAIPRALQTATINVGGDTYQVANLHFTWAPNGIPSQTQINDAYKVSKILEKLKQFVLCGDFNTPVGSEAFRIMRSSATLAEVVDCDSTIDPNFHYEKNLKIVVDALLFTEPYMLNDIQLICGVSDHCALMANMEKMEWTGK